jgi:hypothetical protein
VSEVGVVEGVAAGGDGVFVAGSYCQPVAGVLLDAEGHAAGPVALLLEGRLEQAEVVVVSLGGLDEGVADHGDAGVLELGTELEVDLAVEDGGVVGCLLQDLQEAVDLSPDLALLGLQVLLHLGLDGVNRLLDLAAAHLRLLVLGLEGHAGQQLLHQTHEHVVVSLLVLQVLQRRQQLVVLARLQLDLVQHLDEDGVDAGADGLQRVPHVLFELPKGSHQFVSGVSDGGLEFFDVKGEGSESL